MSYLRELIYRLRELFKNMLKLMELMLRSKKYELNIGNEPVSQQNF